MLSALGAFGSGLLKSRRLRELNVALNAKSLPEVLAYYESRPDLARYTIEQELHRMDYRVKTASGEELSDPMSIEAHYRALRSDEAEAILWRLANQSMLSDLMVHRID